jgi:hypothetical protein
MKDRGATLERNGLLAEEDDLNVPVERNDDAFDLCRIELKLDTGSDSADSQARVCPSWGRGIDHRFPPGAR